jgi:phosphatidylserine/phosphatidylglycerophosphate/cardiolipin synthase-like enzyme
MNSYVLLLPVYRCTLHAIIEKGIHWSEVEHLLLFALSENDFTSNELSKNIGLPRAVVVESIVRMMRVGWVDMVVTCERTSFKASLDGLISADKGVLPPISDRKVRKLKFIIDQFSGEVLSTKGVEFLKDKDAKKLMKSSKDVEKLPIRMGQNNLMGNIDLVSKLSSNPELLYGDEKIASYDSTLTSFEDDWYVKLTVTEDGIKGLPTAGASILQKKINAHFDRKKLQLANQHMPVKNTIEDIPSWSSHPIDLGTEDIIIGGSSHKSLLHSILQKAKSHIIIYSTFIRIGALLEKIDMFTAAANRGVKIDLLWDRQDCALDHRALDAQEAANEFREIIKNIGLENRVVLSDFPLGSHSKLIICDDEKGNYSVTIGSCNWLMSEFTPMEISVRINSNGIVHDCLRVLENLLPHTNSSRRLKEDLFFISKRLGRTTVATSDSAIATLVSTGEHNKLIDKACHEAKQSIFVASNRVGNAIENQVLAPLATAARKIKIKTTLCYQTINNKSEVSKSVMEDLKSKYGKFVDFCPVKKAHAKVLSWDNDHIVITSLNFTSKDDHGDQFGELGIYIKGKNLARYVETQYIKDLGLKSKTAYKSK